MSRSSDVPVGLTPEQANAAAPTGPVPALAGAGTGKTDTLIACVARRIAVRGIPARRILAVTFIDKAAGEMRAKPMCNRLSAFTVAPVEAAAYVAAKISDATSTSSRWF
jgi:ATP-dependent exoDNAse (exonuclease V) beta subunit